MLWRDRLVRDVALLLPLLAVLSGAAKLQAETAIVAVEEDWELSVLTPETASNSPQVTCAMSPVGSDDEAYVSFELNHQSQPEYSSGGLHLHAWSGEYLLGSTHSQPQVTLETSHETISWTQSMRLQDGMLIYEILNGQSESWGPFGVGELRLEVSATVTSLAGYSYEHSLSSSGVGFGANRVAGLVLKRVRCTNADGEVVEFAVDRSVLDSE